MKKQLFLLFALVIPLLATAQEGQKLNTDIDFSFGPHYFDNSNIKNPLSGGISIGYEYDINMLFGVSAGFRFGAFNQSVKYDNPAGNPGELVKDTYKGTYWAPFIAPKIYFPISYDEKMDRPRFLYLENRFSLPRISLDMDKIYGMTGSDHKFVFQYEIRAGYQFPISASWAMNCWVGYNSFNFSKVNPDIIKFKNTTPIQIGIGFNYILKQ